MSGLGQSIMNEAWQKGMQKGIEEGIQEGIQKGIQEGMQQGQNLLAVLVGYLKKDGRLDELDRITDEEARKQLYKEYHLID